MIIPNLFIKDGEIVNYEYAYNYAIEHTDNELIKRIQRIIDDLLKIDPHSKYAGTLKRYVVIEFQKLPQEYIPAKKGVWRGKKEKTREEIEALKESWLSDPCWDLYDTEGFEAHTEELKQFQQQKEAEWGATRISVEQMIDEEAERLGLKGLYRLFLSLQSQFQQHLD